MNRVKITKKFIDENAKIVGLEAKKQHLLEYIGADVELAKNELYSKKFNYVKFRERVIACKNERIFAELLWNALLSGESMSVFK